MNPMLPILPRASQYAVRIDCCCHSTWPAVCLDHYAELLALSQQKETLWRQYIQGALHSEPE